jgi:hypothetical protein
MTYQQSKEIQKAKEYIQTGQTNLARPILARYIKHNPNSEEGWYLLSLAVFEPNQRIDCLHKVLRINPNHPAAKQRLERLQNEQFEKPEKDDIRKQSQSQSQAEQILSLEDISFIDNSKPVGNKKKSKSASKAKKKKRKPSLGLILIILLSLIILLFSFVVAAYFISTSFLELDLQMLENPSYLITALVVKDDKQVMLSDPSNTPTSFQLPATWTATIQPNETPNPTITASPIPSATPTFILPAPVVEQDMDAIQAQVSEIRGLPISGEVDRFLVLPGNVEQMLHSEIISDGTLEDLEEKGRALSLLGLIDPGYDLVNFTMNNLVDNVGGFYQPDKKSIFIIGTRFGGLQRFVYSHEFDHALTDQHFDFIGMGLENCELLNDRCDAIRALIEGDATLVMQIWLNDYASDEDFLELIGYTPPNMALPVESPPDYITQSVNFPYTYGLQFTQALLKQGKWETINQAYQNPPETSEQIMHPEKYFANESMSSIIDIPLESILESSWEKTEQGVLGEWTTFLILAYGVDEESRLDEETAYEAAKGWGTDRYQVFYSLESDQSILSAHWKWDSQSDSEDFYQSMKKSLEGRYRGIQVGDGDCWQATNEVSCLFMAQDETLWLITPDMEMIDKILSIYPNFNS